MIREELKNKTIENLEKQVEELRIQLEEANETIEAIRTGQIDALVVQGVQGHQLFTLTSADQSYRVFVENMTEGAVTLNQEGLILYSNLQFATMVQRPLSQVIGLPFADFIAPEEKSYFFELFEQCWRKECRGESLLISGESRIPVQLSVTTLVLKEGESLSIIVTDLSFQKATQRQLRINNKTLEEINQALELSNHDLQQFASVASHDLQEPLRKIQIFSNLLKEREPYLQPQSLKHLQKIIDSSSRMKTLIIDILNYSRLSATLAIDNIDLNEVVSELAEDFELIIEDKEAQINYDTLPCIEGNKGQIRQVFQNIISNGLKFSKPGIRPVIDIQSFRISEKSFESEENKEGAYCLISIRDNGIGFDDKYVSNIFALFERLNSKDKYEGTGIGLAIAKKVIEKHGGLITATSKEGEGAEFKIILPVKSGC